MMEIGGYFGLEQLISNEYYKDLIALNTARNALLYILKARKIKKLYLPYYLCDSVSEMCDREGYSYDYYRIGYDFLPQFEIPLKNDEYIYIVNYYGQISNEIVLQLKAKYERIILDNVQAFFQRPVQGVDTIYSCRKFFGVPDGAYLSTNCILEEDLSEDVSSGRLKHILGRFETDSASTFYQDFKENDESFNNLELRKMSKLTHNILGAINYDVVRKKREENYSYLRGLLKNDNKLKLNMPAGPYMYPYYSNNGMVIKKELATHKIYIPTLWSNAIDFGGVAKEYSENILPLPIDQRYGISEMERISEVIDNVRRS